MLPRHTSGRTRCWRREGVGPCTEPCCPGSSTWQSRSWNTPETLIMMTPWPPLLTSQGSSTPTCCPSPVTALQVSVPYTVLVFVALLSLMLSRVFYLFFPFLMFLSVLVPCHPSFLSRIVKSIVAAASGYDCAW